MNKKTIIYSFVGLLTSGGLAGLLIANRIQAHSIHPDHPAGTQAPASQSNMMTRPDQYFVEMMIPHHQDAVEMANLAMTRAKRPEIKKFAAAIKRDQTREIQQMRGWYKAWYDRDVPQGVTYGNRRDREWSRHDGEWSRHDGEWSRHGAGQDDPKWHDVY